MSDFDEAVCCLGFSLRSLCRQKRVDFPPIAVHSAAATCPHPYLSHLTLFMAQSCSGMYSMSDVNCYVHENTQAAVLQILASATDETVLLTCVTFGCSR